VICGNIGGVLVGDSYPVRIAGVINCSPESFYSQSVAVSDEDICKKAVEIEESGGAIIDVGGASTAPPSIYKHSFEVSVAEEKERISKAIPLIRDVSNLPISIDTYKAEVAEEALKKGASIVNDVSGLKADSKMKDVLREYTPSLIVMATLSTPGDVADLFQIIQALNESINIALECGIKDKQIVIDPGFGFGKSVSANIRMLKKLNVLKILGKPILVGLSRKSFIGKILEKTGPEKLLLGSLSATAIAVLKGAHVIRTHDVKETVEVVKIAETVRSKYSLIGDNGFEGEIVDFIETPEELKLFLKNRINVSEYGSQIMCRKGIALLILLNNITYVQANIIKQEMLASGGDAAIPSEMADGHLKKGSILVIGSVSQLEKVAAKLRKMPWNLKKVAEILEKIIKEKIAS